MIEKWRAIPGFDGYEVSSEGRVRSWRRSTETPRILAQSKSGTRGVPSASLWLHGKTHRIVVARLVLGAFVGPCPNGHEACHRNDDPFDNKLSNLRWDTHLENMRDVGRNGGKLGPKPGRNPNPMKKLDPEKVRAIRASYVPGKGIAHIAARFGISKAVVYRVIKGIQWAHVQ